MVPNSTATQVKLLKKLLEPMSERDRHCTIMMDEMDIMGTVTFDQQMEQMLGPFKHLQVLMVSGIFTSWKMPVLFGFNQPVTKQLLLDVIKDVEAVGGRVVSTVNDMGSGNLRLWRDLGIGPNAEASIVNPADPTR